MKKESILALLGLAGGLLFFLSRAKAEEKTCANFPLDSACTCPKDYIKQCRWKSWDEQNQKNIYEYYCIPQQYEWVPIDPNDPDIEQKLVEAVKYIMAKIFPDVVPDLSCQPCTGINQFPTPDRPKWFTVVVGSEVPSGRHVATVECDEVTEWDSQGRMLSGIGWFKFNFYLDDGGLLNFGGDLVYINPERTYYWLCNGPGNCSEGPM